MFTGATRTAGAGCWIYVKRCPKHPATKPIFYDAWGATNLQTGKFGKTIVPKTLMILSFPKNIDESLVNTVKPVLMTSFMKHPPAFYGKIFVVKKFFI